MKTGFHTLLIHLADSIHRIDMLICCADNKVEVTGVGIHQAHDQASLADAIGLANILPNPRQRTVWLLTAEAWSGRIELERDIVAQLDARLLLPSLALEAEYDSGFVGADSQLAIERVDGKTPEWLATQVPNQIVDEIRSQANQLGCHVSYINSLPGELEAADYPDDQAIEEAVVAFAKSQIAPSLSFPPVIVENTLITRRNANRAYATAAAIMMVACGGLYHRFHQATVACAYQVAELGSRGQKLDAIHAQLANELREHEELRSQAENEARGRQEFVANRRTKTAQLLESGNTVPQLFDALQHAADDNVWVASLRYTCISDCPQTEIKGLATTPLQVTLFASTLADALNRRQAQWNVSVESIAAKDVATSFKLRIIKQQLSLVPATATGITAQKVSIDRPSMGGPVG